MHEISPKILEVGVREINIGDEGGAEVSIRKIPTGSSHYGLLRAEAQEWHLFLKIKAKECMQWASQVA